MVYTLVMTHTLVIVYTLVMTHTLAYCQTSIIHNTLPWMTTHKEYTSLKPCQGKTQWDKNQWQRKKSTVFLWTFKCFWIASLKPCKGKSSGIQLSKGKRVQLAHILQSIYSPSWVHRSSSVNEKVLMSTHANIMNNLLYCLSCHMTISAWHQYHLSSGEY